MSCDRTAADQLLSVTAEDAATLLVRSGERIEVQGGSGPIGCGGGVATVFNIDRVTISHTGRRGDVIELSGGPFSPGATLDDPNPEIAIDYLTPTFLYLSGTGGADRLTWGPGGGINLNGDNDVDVTGAFTTNIVAGRSGDDVIAAQPDYSGNAGTRIVGSGGVGNDTLIAPADGAVLHGGAGNDRISGGPGADNITAGRGFDRVRSGAGGDLIRAIDGASDRIDCGGGFDKVKADGIDRLKGCEHLIRVKRAEPVR